MHRTAKAVYNGTRRRTCCRTCWAALSRTIRSRLVGVGVCQGLAPSRLFVEPELLALRAHNWWRGARGRSGTNIISNRSR